MNSMKKEEAMNELLTMLAKYAFDIDEAKAIGKALEALRPVSQDQVEKVWRGEWNVSYDEPNAVTYAAMEAAEKGEDMYGPFDSVADLMEALKDDC